MSFKYFSKIAGKCGCCILCVWRGHCHGTRKRTVTAIADAVCSVLTISLLGTISLAKLLRLLNQLVELDPLRTLKLLNASSLKIFYTGIVLRRICVNFDFIKPMILISVIWMGIGLSEYYMIRVSTKWWDEVHLLCKIVLAFLCPVIYLQSFVQRDNWIVLYLSIKCSGLLNAALHTRAGSVNLMYVYVGSLSFFIVINTFINEVQKVWEEKSPRFSLPFWSIIDLWKNVCLYKYHSPPTVHVKKSSESWLL